ncbi:MAG: type II secretion system GspH family protein [Pseudomonadales bacterium]|nr:type II secretion system GspH family protein [Pseudomonadales bacterium]
MYRGYRGFTIIELVVVIILLGILAATALPRFMGVTDEAHQAVFEGVTGSFQTGVSLYHAQWIAQGQPVPNTQILNFNNLRVDADGYPYGLVDRSSGTSTVTTSQDCEDIFEGVLQVGAPSVVDVAALSNVVGRTEDFVTVQATPLCAYYYTAETSLSGATVPMVVYNSATGAVITSTQVLP